MGAMGIICSLLNGINPPSGVWEPLLRFLSSRLSSYALAVILFTVLLKLVLSPLDFFQKYKMKKNAKIGEKIAPEMEKLAKRYADDKTTLQQKQFQLQKASGYSYFSACIPMLLTMVIFITFFAGMRNLSQYEEFSQYYNRYNIYTSRYNELTGFGDDGYTTASQEFDTIINDWHNNLNTQSADYSLNNQAYLEYKQFLNFDEFYKDYIELTKMRNLLASSRLLHSVSDSYTYSINIKYTQGEFNGCYNPKLMFEGNAQTLGQEYNLAMTRYLDGLRMALAQIETDITLNFNTEADFKAVYANLLHYDRLTADYLPILLNVASQDAANQVYNDYVKKDPSFLWIKSIWVADVFWEQAVPSYDKFRTNVAKYMVDNAGNLEPSEFNEVSKRETYDKVMLKVRQDQQLSGNNGWLILAILSLGLSFLSQFIMTRQQKKAGTTMTSNSTMKMMTYLMPVIFGVFALFSTSAFSIYMVTNSLMTLLINLLTTFIIGLVFKRETSKNFNEDGIVKYGRPDPNSFNKKK